MEYYKNKQNDIGVKTIKKVVEAKARKKRKIAKKMEKAKKKAATILENEDLGTREKAKEIQRMYKKAQVRPLTHFFYCFPHVKKIRTLPLGNTLELLCLRIGQLLCLRIRIVFDMKRRPTWALDLPRTLLPKLQRHMDNIRCV